jgi:hypothetical protein
MKSLFPLSVFCTVFKAALCLAIMSCTSLLLNAHYGKVTHTTTVGMRHFGRVLPSPPENSGMT